MRTSLSATAVSNYTQVDAFSQLLLQPMDAASSEARFSAAKALRVIEAPRFDLRNAVDRAAMMQYLEEHGYAVVAAVADAAEVAAAKRRLWDALEMKPEEVLDPAAPDCERKWWPNKTNGECSARHASHMMVRVFPLT